MTGVPIGVVVALIDAYDQSQGRPGLVDRADEKLVRYLQSKGYGSGRYPGQPSHGYVDHTGRLRDKYRSRRGGGPSRRPPTRRTRYRSGAPKGSHRRSFTRSGRRRRKGFYWSYKHKRWMKSKF